MKIILNKKSKGRCLFFATVFLFAACATGAHALEVTVRDTVSKAISTNPDVQSKWHSFLASDRELVSVKGGFLPRLDLAAGLGRENLDGLGYQGRNFQNYSRDGVTLSLTQMLYDGSMTLSRAKRYSHTKRMRYFNLISSIEQVALSAIRSHEDVLRYQMLKGMAERNLARHDEILKKIEERTTAGVDSRINFETTKGRLALARSNLMTEKSNLHDSITQYIRVVGEAPDETLANERIDLALPEDTLALDEKISSDNPLLLAYDEQVKSMVFAISEQRGKMHPRLDFRASTSWEHDIDGVEGRRDKGLIELILYYNLYNGGSDKAEVERYIELHKESEESKKKAERDVKQMALISYNDIKTLEGQLVELDQHRKSADSTRTAYAKQFEAGRRSLLDLLDAENEFFQANRAYANAEFNLTIAKASYLASVGGLLRHFDIVKEELPGQDEIKTDILRKEN